MNCESILEFTRVRLKEFVEKKKREKFVLFFLTLWLHPRAHDTNLKVVNKREELKE